MKTSEKLLSRMRRDLPKLHLPEGSKVERIRVGRNQKAAGAWVWCVRYPSGMVKIGSCDPMGLCVKCVALSMHYTLPDGDVHINAETQEAKP
jgi:hypothetical protein